MANIKSAKKRARQNITLRAHNRTLMSRMRTAIKRVRAAVEQGAKPDATEAYAKAVPLIDTTHTKGLIHGNKAARIKSRLNAQVKALS